MAHHLSRHLVTVIVSRLDVNAHRQFTDGTNYRLIAVAQAEMDFRKPFQCRFAITVVNEPWQNIETIFCQ